MFLRNNTCQIVLILAIVSIPMFSVSLVADAKPGGNYSYCRGPGFSEPRGFGYTDHRQWRSEYSEEANGEQDAFLERSRELRRRITAKERALSDELAHTDIDKGRAMQLQKELSALRSQMDQYHLEHHIEMRKLDSGRVTEDEN